MRFYMLCLVMLVGVLMLGCAGSPVVPSTESDLTGSVNHAGQSQTHLWGYYDIFIDIDNQTAEAILNRQTMFTANVVMFVNNPASNLGFDIYGIPMGADYVDVDIDVSIMHPFPGLPQYNGYDVRGVFMGTGSGSMDYGADLTYPVYGTDQVMYDHNDKVTLAYYDPYGDSLVGMPDGYTRWFNAEEFTVEGLFGYTQGVLATPDYSDQLTSSLNPYKYFADELAADGELWDFLTSSSGNGVFTSGYSNTRNYYLRFPNGAGVQYGYAVIANWEGEEIHPSNAVESVAVSVDITDNIYYVDGSDNGGNLILDIDVFGWEHQPSTIIIESTVLSANYELDAAANGIPGGDYYSTYQVDIPADAISGTEGNEYWVICEYDGFDYTCEVTPSGGAPDANLAAFFRHDLYVSGESSVPPICDIQMLTGISFPYEGFPVSIEFDASGSTDPDGDDGLLTFEWDFDGDMVFGDTYDSGTDATPTKIFDQDFTGDVSVMVTDEAGLDSTCSLTGFDLTIHPSKNIDVTNGTAVATDIGMDPNTGDVLVYYPSVGHVRRYTRSSYYQSHDPYTSVLSHANAQWIDVNFAGYFMLAYYSGSSMHLRFYNTTGNQVSVAGHGYLTLAGLMDVTGFPNAGDHPGGLGTYMWRVYTDYGRVVGHVNYDPGGSGTSFGSQFYPVDGSGTAYYQINGMNAMGGEVDISGNTYWWVERVGSVVKQFTIANNWPYLTSFGEWQVTGDDADHLYEPKDVTRDDENTYYILEELSSGLYTIKGFTYSGTVTTAITPFGDADDWAYTPIRIEGSDYDGILTVLQNDGTDSYISVFTEGEISD